MSGYLLFVDDDSGDIELALMGFRQQGFTTKIAVARDGKDALDRLAADYADGRLLPLAILTDLKMPRMDGLEFLRRLKEDPRLRHIPIGFLSSSSTEADQSEAMRLGARFYAQKPSELKEYSGLVSQLRDMLQPRVAK